MDGSVEAPPDPVRDLDHRRLGKPAGYGPALEPRNAPEWDTKTLESIRRRFMWSTDARATMDAAIRTIFGSESGELSLLHMLAYVRSAGSMNNLISTEAGFQHERIAGGAQSVSLALAKAVGEERVRLSQPVSAISQDASGVTVTSAGGQSYRAQRAIVAVPVPLGSRIDFSPQLPALRQQLMQRAYMGGAVKCFARYENAFWREKGFSGEAACGDGPVSVTFDQCSEDGKTACMLVYVGGKFARTWHRYAPDERRQIIIDRLAKYFGPEARKPIAYAELDWCGERVYRRRADCDLPNGHTQHPWGIPARTDWENPLGGHRDRPAVHGLHRRRSRIRPAGGG